jgi:hypothetical protein
MVGYVRSGKGSLQSIAFWLWVQLFLAAEVLTAVLAPQRGLCVKGSGVQRDQQLASGGYSGCGESGDVELVYRRTAGSGGNEFGHDVAHSRTQLKTVAAETEGVK